MQAHLLGVWGDGWNPGGAAFEADEVDALFFAGAPIANVMQADLELRWALHIASVRELLVVSDNLGPNDNWLACFQGGVCDVEFGLILAFVQILD
jgi:hypothetical protein